MTRTIQLGPDARHQALSALSATSVSDEPLDVLVVGGGVVGAGVALDAVSRGLTTALVEQRDLASGTSSRSSKLVHGGLRYLEMLDFGLVKEALEERGLLFTRLAPHLVRAVPFLYPLRRAWERPYVGAGLLLYDGMATTGRYGMGVPRHSHLFRKQLNRIAPDLRTEELHGAVRYYDCQVDDARLVATLARTAASYGAHVATRTKVTGFVHEGDPAAEGGRRVVGVHARDLENPASHERGDLEIRAHVVINAAGVWTDEIERLAGAGTLDVEASKGIHLVVPRDRIRSECGIIARTEKSVLFVIPWGQHWVIGTTDTAWQFDLAHPAASRADIDYLLDHVNRIVREPLDHDDVQGVYAGLRPLLRGSVPKDEDRGDTAAATTKISREHIAVSPVPGLVLIAGGKLTTYRVMARDAVDLAAGSLPVPVGPSITDRVLLAGASRFETRSNQRAGLARQSGLELGRIDHLLGRYGGLVDEVLDLVAARPELGRPLEGAEDYLSVEVVYAVTHEAARHLDDVLARRTRISIENFDRGVAAALPTARLMAGELGWDEARVQEEVDHYLRRVEAERQSQLKPTDQEADEARVSAPEGPWNG